MKHLGFDDFNLGFRVLGTWDLRFWGLGGKVRVLRTRGRQHAVSMIYIYIYI